MFVRVGCPQYLVQGLNFNVGLGIIGFLGAGSAVLGMSPAAVSVGLSYAAPLVAYWVNVSADYIVYHLFDPHLTMARLGTTQGPTAATGFEPLLYLGRALTNTSVNKASPSVTAAAPQGSLEAFKMSAPTNEELSRWVRPDLLQAGAVLRKQNGSYPDNFWVEKPLAHCKLCDSGTVEGPASESCTVSESCSSGARDRSNQTVDYPEHYILIGRLSLVAASEGRVPTAVETRDAVKAVVGGGNNHTGLKVAVWSSALPSSFLDPTEAPESEAALGSVDYSLAFVATSGVEAEAITDAMQGNESHAAPLLEALRSHLANSSTPVDGVSGSLGKSLQVPSYNQLGSTKGARRGAGGGSASVAIVQEGHEAVPVASVARRTSYIIQLERFLPSLALQVMLVGMRQTVATGAWAPYTFPLGTVTTDGNGDAELAWDVPVAIALGSYYVRAAPKGDDQATPTASMLGMSTAFQVTEKPKRRKP